MFTYFPDLPTELRCKIWKTVCFHPRNVDIWTWYMRGSIFVRWNSEFHPFRYRSNCPFPSVLQTCKESRNIGLEFYTLEFGTRCNFEHFTFSTPPRIYVNFAVNGICDLADSYCTSASQCEQFLKTCSTNGTRLIELKIDSSMDHDDDSLLGYRDESLWQSTSSEEVVLFESGENLDIRGKVEFEDFDRGVLDMAEDALLILDKARNRLRRRFEDQSTSYTDWDEDSILRQHIKFASIIINGSRR